MTDGDRGPQSPVLEARGLRKAFGPVEVLKDVSFDLKAGEILALMGVNGAGKSTLMNILSGVLRVDVGEIWLQGRRATFAAPVDAHQAGVAMVHQELHLVRELSIAENIFLGEEPRTRWGLIDRRAMNDGAQTLLRRLSSGRSPMTRVAELGVAEQQIVEIAKALARQARLLILDEPTAALSENETARLFEILRALQREGVSMIYVSHRLDEVEAIADRVVILRDGVKVTDAPTTSLTRPQMIRDMVGGDVAEAARDRHAAPGDVLLRVRNLRRVRRGGQTALDRISFDLRRGEILGLAGLMGAGRTELLEVLAGACEDPWSGDVQLDGRPYRPRQPADAITDGVAFVTEDRKASGLVLQQSIAANTALATLEALSRGGLMREREVTALAQRSMTQLDIRAESPRQGVASLSGGNQQKVVLAKWLAVGPSLLLLDEPTRGVDVAAKAAIYRLLNGLTAAGLSVLLVSSDWAELMALSDRILVLQAGEPSAVLRPEAYAQSTLLDLATAGGPRRVDSLAESEFA